MLPEERKGSIARLAHGAINQRDLALLDDQMATGRPGGSFPALHAFPGVSSPRAADRRGTWVTTRTTHATHLGAFMGVAPTGRAIEIMHISLDQVEGGKVVEHFGVSDWLRALITFEIVAASPAVTSEATR